MEKKKKKVSSPKSKRNVAEYRFQYEKVSQQTYLLEVNQSSPVSFITCCRKDALMRSYHTGKLEMNY